MAPAVVEALDSPDEHRAPIVALRIGDRTLLGLDGATVDLSAHFEDADGDELTYSAFTGDAEIVRTVVEGSTLTLTPARRGAATVTVRATNAAGLSLLETFAVTVDREWGETDFDTDDDGLIEIATLEQLDAVRLDLDGDGAEDALAAQDRYFEAFPDAVRDMGCAADCTGYELTRNLDFDEPASYASGRADRGWSQDEGGSGWEPIGSSPVDQRGLVRPEDCFDGDFHGNGRAIANLLIDRSDRDNVGLFGGFREAGRPRTSTGESRDSRSSTWTWKAGTTSAAWRVPFATARTGAAARIPLRVRGSPGALRDSTTSAEWRATVNRVSSSAVRLPRCPACTTSADSLAKARCSPRSGLRTPPGS